MELGVNRVPAGSWSWWYASLRMRAILPASPPVRGTDVQALDLFASAPNLCLLRTVVTGSGATDEHDLRRGNNTFDSTIAKKRRVLVARNWRRGRRIGEGRHREAGRSDSGVRPLRGGNSSSRRGRNCSFAFPRFACRVGDLSVFFFSYSLAKIWWFMCRAGHANNRNKTWE